MTIIEHKMVESFLNAFAQFLYFKGANADTIIEFLDLLNMQYSYLYYMEELHQECRCGDPCEHSETLCPFPFNEELYLA